MTFGQFHAPRESSSRPLTSMADINVTPMVDVMLVLLVIFIIAAPFMTHAVKLDLPQAQSEAAPEQADTVSISFDADGILYWNNQVLAMTELEAKLAVQAKKNKQAEIQLRADKATRYEIIAKVMAAAQSQGLAKISFVTDSKQAKKP
ncbi:ExbD/TolR family protein [Undibacterium pigrum]|uniref:Outer membrane transport energization protein ExbD n=1 Tax=Undibacterium pigrum TaxID=401470 RepID=A0A318JTW1_9BURK|nr:biopolymer transporter ExbD [Undibacterium pigrum]PXX43918.1 outer membrane transport energization protein ExbD [Undibacterium pigrum]